MGVPARESRTASCHWLREDLRVENLKVVETSSSYSAYVTLSVT
jgi:hypothetical protein